VLSGLLTQDLLFDVLTRYLVGNMLGGNLSSSALQSKRVSWGVRTVCYRTAGTQGACLLTYPTLPLLIACSTRDDLDLRSSSSIAG